MCVHTVLYIHQMAVMDVHDSMKTFEIMFMDLVSADSNFLLFFLCLGFYACVFLKAGQKTEEEQLHDDLRELSLCKPK